MQSPAAEIGSALKRKYGFRDANLAHARHRAAWLDRYTRKINAAYDAAQTNPEMERYWAMADYRGPRMANDTNVRKLLRSRSRYECRESNSFARGMLLTKTNDVIGTGPNLQVQTTSQEFNRAVETRFAEWARSVHLGQKLRTAYGAKLSDGETFIERVNNPLAKTPHQLDLRVTEADLWTNPEAGLEDPKEVDGIRYDDIGNPVTYRRLRAHPGDPLSMSQEFDDINAEDVIHWFRVERPDQRRGFPEFTPALPLFAELRRYRLAVISAAEVAAELTAVMYSDAPAFGQDPDEMDEDFLTFNLERRAAVTLPAGWNLKQLTAEQPTTGFEGFCDHILMEVGRVTLMPLNIVSGSSRDMNFASGRLDYLLYWNACDVEQDECISTVLERIFDWWLQEAIFITDYLPSMPVEEGEAVPHRWQFPPRRPIDEIASAQADEIRFRLGQLTDEYRCKRDGVDIDEWRKELEETITKRQEMGAPLPGAMPGLNQGTGNENQDPTAPGQKRPAEAPTSRRPDPGRKPARARP